MYDINPIEFDCIEVLILKKTSVIMYSFKEEQRKLSLASTV